jgi:hypothetical protein
MMIDSGVQWASVVVALVCAMVRFVLALLVLAVAVCFIVINM